MTLRDFDIETLPEFDKHYLVIHLRNEQSLLNGFIAIHRGDLKHASFGATRLWKYGTEKEALKDALRLSRAMSYKAALAGLDYGGAKGVLFDDALDQKQRRRALEAYAERVNLLNGQFITGTDVGLTPADVRLMSKKTPFMVGLRSDPTESTAQGLYHALQASLYEAFGTEDLEGRSFAIQGLGKIGAAFLKVIYKHAGRIVVADLDRHKIKQARTRFPKITAVSPEEIIGQKVDIFCPCAMSGSLSLASIRQLKSAVVIGGANNQLEKPEVGDALFRSGILYAPDYVVNAGGLISVVDEYENKNYDPERVAKRVMDIRKNLVRILRVSKETNTATNYAADDLAEQIVNEKFHEKD